MQNWPVKRFYHNTPTPICHLLPITELFKAGPIVDTFTESLPGDGQILDAYTEILPLAGPILDMDCVAARFCSLRLVQRGSDMSSPLC